MFTGSFSTHLAHVRDPDGPKRCALHLPTTPKP